MANCSHWPWLVDRQNHALRSRSAVGVAIRVPQFLVLVGADKEAAKALLDSIKIELETNDLLMDDFPEVCHAIRSLDGLANRCKGQTCNGHRTHIKWVRSQDHHADGGQQPMQRLDRRCKGLTGGIRGLKHITADGVSLRPDIVVIDDPQTEESANSVTQCESRVRILAVRSSDSLGPELRSRA